MFFTEKSTTARIHSAMRQSREINELIGICKGVLADGVVNLHEAMFILEWLETHQECIDIWPASELYQTLDLFLEDGALSLKEESQLIETLMGITGVTVKVSQAGTPSKANTTTTLPLHEPQDGLEFDGRNFVLTGTFTLGTRSHCENLVKERGGLTQSTPTKKTHYLVVGEIGSRDWAHSSFGRKIQKAAEMRRSGHEIFIISEQLLTNHL